MDLISIIIIVAIIKKVIEKANEASNKVERYDTTKNVWDQVAEQVKSAQNQARKYDSTENHRNASQNEQWKRVAKENIEKARKRAAEKLREVEAEAVGQLHKENTYSMPKKNVRTTPAYEQIHAGRMEAQNTSILQRAVKNADEDKVDVTLETMEREHNHSERVSPAEHHHSEDVMPESMLGSIEDLMIKGYDGNLCFERDFVGEAMDMISRFTVPSDIPDFSKDDVA